MATATTGKSVNRRATMETIGSSLRAIVDVRCDTKLPGGRRVCGRVLDKMDISKPSLEGALSVILMKPSDALADADALAALRSARTTRIASRPSIHKVDLSKAGRGEVGWVCKCGAPKRRTTKRLTELALLALTEGNTTIYI